MGKEEVQDIAFQIISHVGTAFSYFYEAVNLMMNNDKQKCEEEALKSGYVKEELESVDVESDVVNEKRVLVLCAGGGTSGLLANALLKGAEEKGIKMITAAGSYGAHYDMLKDYDLVILAPQVANYYEDLKKDTDRLGIKSAACEGKKYIELTRNPQKALEFVFSILDENNE